MIPLSQFRSMLVRLLKIRETVEGL